MNESKTMSITLTDQKRTEMTLVVGGAMGELQTYLFPLPRPMRPIMA